MPIINDTLSYPLKVWEDRISSRDDIEYTGFQLHHGLVCGASGLITVSGCKINARWLHDGRCYCKGKRKPLYDIKF